MSSFFKNPLLAFSSLPPSLWRLHTLQLSLQPLMNNFSESPVLWLGMYFLTNLALTIYNKTVLIEFPFPYTLTALHALCSTAGAALFLRSGAVSTANVEQKAVSLNFQEHVTLILFSMLFTVNIAVSNISLHLVTIPFHQVVRATTPVCIVLLSRLLLNTRSSRNKLLALLLVVAGASVATYGAFSFSRWGFFMTLLGTVLSAMKTIATHLLQTSGTRANAKRAWTRYLLRFLEPRPTLSTLSPIELLRILSPLACIQSLILAYFTGELEAMYQYSLLHVQFRQRVLLVIDGLLAFGLNIASFGTNKRVGALTMTVAGNVKQVLTMLLAVIVFNTKITPMHALGIVITLFGGACYTAVELREKKKLSRVRRFSLPELANHNDVSPDSDQKPNGVQKTRNL